MNLIKINSDLYGDITADNTYITADMTIITADTTMIEGVIYTIRFIPRKLEYNLYTTIKEGYSNQITSLNLIGEDIGGLLSVDLVGFIPVPDVVYDITFTNNNTVIWNGQAMYTQKNIQNYKLNESDENNLRY